MKLAVSFLALFVASTQAFFIPPLSELKEAFANGELDKRDQYPLLNKGDKVTVQTQWDYVDCGSPTDVLQIKTIDLTPDPPVPGEDLVVYGDGYVSTLVDSGSYADVVVKLGLIKLLTKRFDLCEELANANSTLQCPIKPGFHSITQEVELPEEIPKARYQIQIRAATQTELPLACLDININFLLPDAN